MTTQRRWLTNLRLAMGLTQKGLAEQLGINRVAVTQWESGVTSPSRENAIRLERILGSEVHEHLAAELDHPSGEEVA